MQLTDFQVMALRWAEGRLTVRQQGATSESISAEVCAHWGEHYHLTPKEVAQYRLWVVARNARLAQVPNGYVTPAVQETQSFEEIARTIADLRSEVSSAGLPQWVRARRALYYTMLWNGERYERERFCRFYLASSLFVNNCLAADFIYHRRTGSDRLLVLEKVLVEAWFNQASNEVRHRMWFGKLMRARNAGLLMNCRRGGLISYNTSANLRVVACPDTSTRRKLSSIEDGRLAAS